MCNVYTDVIFLDFPSLSDLCSHVTGPHGFNCKYNLKPNYQITWLCNYTECFKKGLIILQELFVNTENFCNNCHQIRHIQKVIFLAVYLLHLYAPTYYSRATYVSCINFPKKLRTCVLVF